VNQSYQRPAFLLSTLFKQLRDIYRSVRGMKRRRRRKKRQKKKRKEMKKKTKKKKKK
jgi:hypothetical protein